MVTVNRDELVMAVFGAKPEPRGLEALRAIAEEEERNFKIGAPLVRLFIEHYGVEVRGVWRGWSARRAWTWDLIESGAIPLSVMCHDIDGVRKELLARWATERAEPSQWTPEQIAAFKGRSDVPVAERE